VFRLGQIALRNTHHFAGDARKCFNGQIMRTRRQFLMASLSASASAASISGVEVQSVRSKLWDREVALSFLPVS
jgi:hypothetical protein